MNTRQVHRLSTIALIALSLTAALTVLLAVAIVVLSGQAPQPAHDEGTAAHIFQLTVVAVAIAFSVLSYFERVLGY